jgi:hypothetical protein
MNLFDPPNLVLIVIVVAFWAVVMLFARMQRGRVSLNLLILPFFFIIMGLSVNRYRPAWGTYAIGLIHVMMLPALLRVAKARK